MIKTYLITILIIIITILIYSHNRNFRKTNSKLEILQFESPTPEIAYELMQKKLPLIFRNEIGEWGMASEILGNDITEIKKILKLDTSPSESMAYNDMILNLSFYSLPFSKPWSVSIESIKNDETSKIKLTLENEYLHLVGCISQEFRVILVSPDMDPKLLSDPDKIEKELLDPNGKIPSLEIIIREGNMLYIPYGWHYFIYHSNNAQPIIFQAINKSWIGW
jgi:hypothetical protein